MIVANNLKVAGAGLGPRTNVVTLITREGERERPSWERIRWRPIAGRDSAAPVNAQCRRTQGVYTLPGSLFFSEQSPASLCPFPSTFA